MRAITLLAKRLVVIVIKGSLAIWAKAKRETLISSMGKLALKHM
jgi:hypothetical protein